MTTQTSAETVRASLPSPKEQFLDAYEREHATTVKVLRAYPTDQLDLRPAPKSKTARELAWMFAMERRLGTHLMNNAFAGGGPSGGKLPDPPESWDDLIDALEQAHREFGTLVRGYSDAELLDTVKFFVAPHTLGDFTRLQVLWFLLCDQIHHRGQFSVYLRMAGAKVPSIYGPTADEPWM